ncbi:MAG: hypothetical protein L3J66_03805 [Bacteroidales bacterium]|nr:hypothetical protein [Bacteroidales bacterium]
MEDLTLGIGSRVAHPEFGKGVVVQVYNDNYEITFLDYGTKTIARAFDNLTTLDFRGSETDLLSFEKVEGVFRKLLLSITDIQAPIHLAEKWKGGHLILQPGMEDLQEKTIPIDTFFHKIVMVRDRLRVMEQKINASKGLNDEEKVELQQYITRIYGSLTTFNILFDDKADHFVGERGK